MSENNGAPPPKGQGPRKLVILIAIYFLAEALCQPDGLIYQPMTGYLKDVLGWHTDAVTNFYSLMSVPLLLRPLYGILCDSVPLFGYRRKTYLALFMLLNTIGYTALIFLQAPLLLYVTLMVAAVGVAAGSTLASAVIVENGNQNGSSGSLINIQWFWFNLGVLVFAKIGGWLADTLPVSSAYHTAATVVAVGPAFVVVAVFFLLDEPRTKTGVDMALVQDAWSKLKAVLMSKPIWLASGFIAVYNLSPLMQVPLYYHMRDTLHFSGDSIGTLLAVQALGAMVASFLYAKMKNVMSLKHLLFLGVVLLVASRLDYLLVTNYTMAVIVWFLNGVMSMIVLIPCLALAALRSPKGLEAFGYGLMTCFLTLSRIVGNTAGSWLYEHYFNHNITALVLLAAVLAALALPLVARLGLTNERG